jgi:butyryl-CoA dehydrogenase
MDFALSDEQRMFRQMFADFSANEIAPKAEEIDRSGELPAALLQQAAQQGFLGATLPETYFGAELDQVSYVLLLEAFSRECVSFAVSLASHVSLVAMSIFQHGDEDQRDAWLPEAGSDIRGVRTRITAHGDEAVLDGVKCWVANGSSAGLFLVFGQGPAGLDAYLVPSDTAGLHIGQKEPTLGLRSVSFNRVYLEGCRVPMANRLGKPGEGFAVAERAQERMSVALAAAGLGVAEGSIDVAAQFATERVQFGVPIAKKQAIQNYVAESTIETEALRHLVYRAAWSAQLGGDWSLEAAMAKAYGARVARSVTNRMVQVMGGYGYMEDYPLARRYRDARMLALAGVTTELQLVQVARHVFAQRGIEVAP